MAVFRTPSAIFHPDVSFIMNGELGTEDVLNRPLFSLDDKAQFLKETQDSVLASNSALRSAVGEADGVDTPTWNTPTHFVQGASHHTAIEGLDQSLSNLAANSDSTRLDNMDIFLMGEDSTVPANPDWTDGATRTPLFVQIGDTHHQAIVRLDIAASLMRADVDQNLSDVSTLQSQVATVITDLAAAQVAIGSLETEVDAISILVDTHTSQIDTNESQIILTRSQLSLLESQFEVASVVVDENSCVIEKMKSQINELRADHGRAAIATWCP